MLGGNRRVHDYYVSAWILLHDGKELNQYLHMFEINSENYIHCVVETCYLSVIFFRNGETTTQSR